MRKTLYISILILVLSGIANAQISGQLFQDESEFPGVQVYFKNSDKKVESDFDGYFKLEIPSRIEKSDLILSGYGITIEIKNLEFDTAKLDLGKIEFPAFKIIDIDEFEKLTKLEKQNCYPIYCWTDLLGYSYTNELENEFLTLNCKEKITEFEFNQIAKTITLDWNTIKNCE
ncbi:hypothetical protein [Psychroserpens burtonensis]|uniref:hypothetical protein n=1 Tax=Psychroserpens burtonensis TaxID=49278 RepID=UPI0003F87FC2|nr:hypothetical protein [Psychroserpens burtonensis]